MKLVQLTSCLTEAEADAFAGTQLTLANADTIYRESVKILKPDGEVLAIYLKRVIPEELCEVARRCFRHVKGEIKNRGMAVGGKGANTSYMRRDGVKSNSNFVSPDKLRELGMSDAVSGVAGFMDRYPRMPFCRLTAFNVHHSADFKAAMPFIEAINFYFLEHAPDRYANQLAVIKATSPDFVIPGTAFTTITVNKNFPTRVHQDAGDLKEGFGVMSVVRTGLYSGGQFIFPRYRVGFDLGSGDVLLADVHEWHGNTAIKGRGKYERMSFVFYYRERMKDCGSAEQELARAKTGTKKLR